MTRKNRECLTSTLQGACGFGLLAVLAMGIACAGPTGDPSQTAGDDQSSASGGQHGVLMSFKKAGQPAVPSPEPADLGWSQSGYSQLIPSSPDGEPTFSNDWFSDAYGLYQAVHVHRT